MKKKRKLVGKLLLGSGVIMACAVFLFLFIITGIEDTKIKMANADKTIQSYCDAAPERRVDIQFEVKLMMQDRRPEHPRGEYGWAYRLSDQQILDLMKIRDGVQPTCSRFDRPKP